MKSFSAASMRMHRQGDTEPMQVIFSGLEKYQKEYLEEELGSPHYVKSLFGGIFTICWSIPLSPKQGDEPAYAFDYAQEYLNLLCNVGYKIIYCDSATLTWQLQKEN